MEHMFGMEFYEKENYRVYLADYLQKSYSDIDLMNSIDKVINGAKDVYAFRSHSHLSDESVFIQWLKKNATDKNDNICVICTKLDNREEFFESCNKNEYVYRLEFNDSVKCKFKELFKISIRDVKKEMDNQNPILTSNLFIDDPLYDQFDFIFTTNQNVLLITSIHDFVFIFSDQVVK